MNIDQATMMLWGLGGLAVFFAMMTITSFNGAFHHANYKMLFRAKKLNDKILASNDEELKALYMIWLTSISVEHNKPSYFGWLLGKAE